MLDLDRVGALCKAIVAPIFTVLMLYEGWGILHLISNPNPVIFGCSSPQISWSQGCGLCLYQKKTALAPRPRYREADLRERGLRAGTESVHNIIGLQKAIEMAYENLEKESAYILGLKKYFISQLKNLFPSAHFNGLCGNSKRSTYTLVNVALPLEDSKSRLREFSLGSPEGNCLFKRKCMSRLERDLGSHVLGNLKRPEAVKKLPSLRFSFSSFNTIEEIDCASRVSKSISKLDLVSNFGSYFPKGSFIN